MVATPVRSFLALLVLPAVFATPLSYRQEDPQRSLTLDPSNIMKGLEQDGQGASVQPGQVRSKTSSNNFINFCLTQRVPITDGKQIDGGSCNPAPIGRIAAKNKMPASKFINPPNFSDTLVEDQPFDIKMKIQNLVTGLFTNAETSYYASPQQVDGNGVIRGHTHFTIQRMPRDDLRTTITINPQDFVFFKGLTQAADGNGILTQNVSSGLKAGNYRLCSINASMSHAPVISAIAQRGSHDDCVYFTVKPKQGNGNSVKNVGGGGDPRSSAPPPQSPATQSARVVNVSSSAREASPTTSASSTSASPPAQTPATQGSVNGGENKGRFTTPQFLQNLIDQILKKGKDFFQKFRQQSQNN